MTDRQSESSVVLVTRSIFLSYIHFRFPRTPTVPYTVGVERITMIRYKRSYKCIFWATKKKKKKKFSDTIVRIRVVDHQLSSFYDDSSLVCLFCSFLFTFFLAVFLLRFVLSSPPPFPPRRLMPPSRLSRPSTIFVHLSLRSLHRSPLRTRARLLHRWIGIHRKESEEKENGRTSRRTKALEEAL